MTSDTPPKSSNSERMKQPNSRYCFGCGVENSYGLGLRFYEIGPAKLEAEYTVPDHFQGYPGIVHGGIVATMLDEVLGRVVMIGDHSRFMMTARLEVRYRKYPSDSR
jgi:acyl-coenzyme A thioesterase PaaI-like protein